MCRARKTPVQYVLDESVAQNAPHKILRLPPYHSCYNPIELVWGLSKRYFDKHVGRGFDYSNKKTDEIWDEALAQVTPTVWEACCKKVERRILADYAKEIVDDDLPDYEIQIVTGRGIDAEMVDEELEQGMEEMETREAEDTTPPDPTNNNSANVCRVLFEDTPTDVV